MIGTLYVRLAALATGEFFEGSDHSVLAADRSARQSADSGLPGISTSYLTTRDLGPLDTDAPRARFLTGEVLVPALVETRTAAVLRVEWTLKLPDKVLPHLLAEYGDGVELLRMCFAQVCKPAVASRHMRDLVQVDDP